MYCSVCGRPLPPDGVCRNHPAPANLFAPAQPQPPREEPINLFPPAQPQPGDAPPEAAAGKAWGEASKPVPAGNNRDAWFAPAGVAAFFVCYAIHALLNVYGYQFFLDRANDPDAPIAIGHTIYGILSFVSVMYYVACGTGISVALYRRAVASRGEAFVRGHLPMALLPGAAWFASCFAANAAACLLPEEARASDAFTGYSLMTDFVFAALFAAAAFALVRVFLRDAERLYAGTAEAPTKPYKRAAWFAPVSVLFGWAAETGAAVLVSETHVYDKLPRMMDFESLFFFIGTVISGLLLYRKASRGWGAARSRAHRELAVVPFAVGFLFYVALNNVLSLLYWIYMDKVFIEDLTVYNIVTAAISVGLIGFFFMGFIYLMRYFLVNAQEGDPQPAPEAGRY